MKSLHFLLLLASVAGTAQTKADRLVIQFFSQVRLG
jgi:hypothetical protein